MSDFSANITGVEKVSVCYWTILTVLIAVVVVVVTVAGFVAVVVFICHREATKRYQMRQEAERQERFARQEAEKLQVFGFMQENVARAIVAMHEATMIFK